MANSTVYQSKWKPIVEPRRAKPKTYRQAIKAVYSEGVLGVQSNLALNQTFTFMRDFG